VDGTAAVHEFQVIHGTNTHAARDNITFFAFHTFLVEVHSNEAKIELGPKNNSRACVCNSNVEIRVAGSSGSPATKNMS